jgi:hypothetical protein
MVTLHCVAGRINGAEKTGNLCLLSKEVEKPAGGRQKKGSKNGE